MNKKGLTVVELIVSFTLTFAIVIFLIQIITNLTKVYNNNGKKTELLNKQSIISNELNTAFMEKGLIGIETCGDNCYNFYYLKGETDTLKLNNNILMFNNVAIELQNATYGDLILDVVYTPTIQVGVDDGIFVLNIPINNEMNYNYDVKVIYQFNTENSSIDEYFTS